MSTSAPRVKSRGRDSDDEEDDGKITAEEESEIDRIMGRNQPQPQRKGALSLAERAQQRVLMASGLPAVPKTILQDILSSPESGPRSSAALASTLGAVPRASARNSQMPVDEETRKKREAEKKAREELLEQLRKEEEELEKEEDSDEDEEGNKKKKEKRD